MSGATAMLLTPSSWTAGRVSAASPPVASAGAAGSAVPVAPRTASGLAAGRGAADRAAAAAVAVESSFAELLRQRFGGVGEGLALPDLGDQRAEHVDRGQENIGKRLDVVEGTASEGAEEVLHGMGQLGHAAVADGRCRPLERVGGPKHFIDHAGIEIVLEFEQTLFDALDLLHRLVCEQTVVTRLQIEGQQHLRQPLSVPRGA